MQFQRLSLDESAQATGTVIVIDVLRAFTSACYAFGAGAGEIILVSQVSEAFALRQQFPNALLMGEEGGGPIPGFDFSNSPAEYDARNLSGQTLIQRTSNGTQGVIRATRADEILAASFVCAGATARYLRQRSPSLITFVITAWRANSMKTLEGDEDAACADYLEALLTESKSDPAEYLDRVANSPMGQVFLSGSYPIYSPTDVPYCVDLDRFNFSLPIQRNAEGLLVMKPALT